MLKVLRNKNFTLIWFSGLISIAGNWVLLAALPFYIYEITGSALATAGVFMAFMGPGIILGSIAGVFVDRWNKITTMLIVNILQVGVVLLLTLVQSADWAWLVFVVLVIEASIAQFFGLAENALLPKLVGKEDLVAANSLNSMNDNLARLAAPAIGGLVLANYGFTNVVLIDALTYLVAAGLILTVWLTWSGVDEPTKTPLEPKAASLGQHVQTVLAEWRDGFQIVWEHHILRSTFIIISLGLLGDAFVSSVLVIFLQDDLNMGAAEFGYIMTARGVGGLVGGILIAQFGERLNPKATLILSLLLLGAVITAAVLWTKTLVGMMLLLAVGGVPAVGMFIAVQTIFQTVAPGAYLGRVFGLFQTVIALLMFIGYFIGGLLGETVPASAIVFTGALIYLAAGIIGLLLLRRVDLPHAKQDLTADTAG